MNKKSYLWLAALAALLIASLACSALGDGPINFQTDMNLTDTIAFYREAFTKLGYTERTINTAITDTTFSMVFDGHASGKAIVIQGVDLGGSTNVHIRFEAI